jgi:hypothetical protein
VAGKLVLLVGGPYDGTVVAEPDGDDLLAGAHLYESVDHEVGYRGQQVRVFVHREDCCRAGAGDVDECE